MLDSFMYATEDFAPLVTLYGVWINEGTVNAACGSCRYGIGNIPSGNH